ncbi:MAG TPA: dihydrofolate reductase family protein [Opitutaceae bacterium]
MSLSKVRSRMSISLDGYVAGPHQTAETPLGIGGERLHEWFFPTKSFREMHGQSGGETGIDDDMGREAFSNVGAAIIGRNMFGPIRGDWGDGSWRGWWGENPPFHYPVFVLTHHPREPLVMQGGTTFHFVTEGIESALAQARAVAGGKDIFAGGGAQTIRQYLAAGLVDQLELQLVPILLGGGERLFDGLGADAAKFEVISAVQGKQVTHLTYRARR